MPRPWFAASPESARPRRAETSPVLASLSFLLSMGAFSLTMAPSIYPGDSPEFTAAAHVMGIPHPPGYAHYVLLGNLAVRLIPFGNVAFRLNLLSALGGALTAALLSLLVFRWTERFLPALAAGLILAVSRDFWAQAGSGEVYTVLPLFLVLLIHVGLGGRIVGGPEDTEPAPGSRIALWMSSFVWGYATGIHYFILFVLPGGLVLLAGRYGWRTVGRSFGAMTLCALAGWSLFLLLPIRSLVGPPLNWGEIFRPDNFLKHIFWSTYAERPVRNLSWLEWGRRALDFLVLCARQWPVPVLALIPPGLFWLARRRSRAEMLAVALLAVVPAAATIVLLNDPSREFFFGNDSNKFLLVFPVLAGVAGLGLAQAEEWLAGWTLRAPLRSAALASAVVATVGAGCVGLSFHANRPAADRSAALALHAYTLNLVDALPRDAGLAVEGDVPTFPLLYLRYVEEDRPDLSLYGRFGILFANDYNAADSAPDGEARERVRLQIDNALARRHPGRMFFSNRVEDHAPSLDLLPRVWGLVYAADNAFAGGARSTPDLLGSRFIRDPVVRPGAEADQRTCELAGETYLMAAFDRAAAARGTEAAGLVDAAVSVARDSYWVTYHGGLLRYGAWSDAAGAGALLEKASTILPNEFVFNALGVVRLKTGDLDGAAAAFRRSLAMKESFLPSSVNLAETCIARGMYAEASGLLEAAARRHPDQPEVWMRLGEVQGFLQRFDAAAQSFGQAVRLRPGDGEPYFLRAVAEAAAGRPDAAVADARRAVVLSPDRPAYKRFLSRISMR